MPLQAIEPKRLYRQIADQLRALIGDGEFPVGSRLPPERDLAVQLGVSRPSVREALIALEVEGLVEVRMGSGIYITSRDASPLPKPLDGALGPFEIIRARQLIEGELVAVVARQPTPALLRGLRETVTQMQNDIARGVMPLAADRLFHVRLAEASENSALLRVVTELFDERNNPLFQRLGNHFEGERSWRAAVAEHKAVIAGIAARDPERARAAMHAHLQKSHDRFAAGWAEDVPVPARRRKVATP